MDRQTLKEANDIDQKIRRINQDIEAVDNHRRIHIGLTLNLELHQDSTSALVLALDPERADKYIRIIIDDLKKERDKLSEQFHSL